MFDLWSALWAWPLTLIMLVLWIATMRATQFGDEFQNTHALSSSLVMGAGLGLILGLGLKRGFKLVPLHSDESASSESHVANGQ